MKAFVLAVTLLFSIQCSSAPVTRNATEHQANHIARAYRAWLRTVGLGRVVRVDRVIAGRPLLPPDHPAQTWTVHLLLPKAAGINRIGAPSHWKSIQEEFVGRGALAQRLFFRAAQYSGATATQVQVLITPTRYDVCWHVILVVDDEGFSASERDCGRAHSMVTRLRDLPSDVLRDLIASSGGSCGTTSSLAGLRLVAGKGTDQHNSPSSLDVLEQRLRTHFAGARYQVLARTPVLREVLVDNMKSVVLKDTHRWEKLKVVLVAAPHENDVTVILNVDGQHAPGLGKRPPPARSYHDMEPDHALALAEFTSALLTSITSP